MNGKWVGPVCATPFVLIGFYVYSLIRLKRILNLRLHFQSKNSLTGRASKCWNSKEKKTLTTTTIRLAGCKCEPVATTRNILWRKCYGQIMSHSFIYFGNAELLTEHGNYVNEKSKFTIIQRDEKKKTHNT